MEARGETQHRTQVKPRKAGPIWVSVLVNATPDYPIVVRTVLGTAAAGSCSFLPQEISPGPHWSVGHQEGNDAGPKPGEKSDHPIVARKPAKAGGAKGVMG